MTAIDDGGPAFPAPDGYRDNDGLPSWRPGMSLLDWFAQTVPADEISGITYKSLSQAAQERLIRVPMPRDPGPGPDLAQYQIDLAEWHCTVNARLRFMHAQAMLAERRRLAVGRD